MGKFWGKKDGPELLGSPQETMGFSKEYSSLLQNFIIRKYDFSNPNQVDDIKKQLLGRRILLVNAKEFLENGDVTQVKSTLEELKTFLSRLSLSSFEEETSILMPLQASISLNSSKLRPAFSAADQILTSLFL